MIYRTSRFNIPAPLKIGKGCAVITDSDTTETIREKISLDVGYVIDMRTKITITLEDLFNGNTQKTKKEKKRHDFF